MAVDNDREGKKNSANVRLKNSSSKLNFLTRDKISFVGARASGAWRQILFVGALSLVSMCATVCVYTCGV